MTVMGFTHTFINVLHYQILHAISVLEVSDENAFKKWSHNCMVSLMIDQGIS